jgi:hypothetical protein
MSVFAALLLYASVHEIDEMVAIAKDPPESPLNLDPALHDLKGNILTIDYKDSQFFKDALIRLNHGPVLIHGANNAGNTVFAKYIARYLTTEEGGGDYVLYLSPDRDRYANVGLIKELLPKRIFADLPHTSRRSDKEFFRKLLVSKQAKNQRVTVIVDDAQWLERNHDGVGFLLNCHLGYGMGLLFVSSNDAKDPPFSKSSGYHSRLESIRFVSDLKPFESALTKTGLCEANVQTILKATGPNAGDIVDVLRKYWMFKDKGLNYAIATRQDKSFQRISSAIDNVDVVSVPFGDLTSTEACDLLALVSMGKANAVNLYEYRYLRNDPVKLRRMMAVGKFMVEANVLSYGNSCARFVWRRQMLADAYKMNVEKLEERRRETEHETWWSYWLKFW